jgi:NAD(P)H-dependent FMN reductase
MITIIAGTNRADSKTLLVANLYYKLLSARTDDVQVLSLEQKQVWERGESMLELEQKFLIPAERFIFIMPEYNASFPGILKVMIDNSDIKKCWWYKKAALVGISDGRAGNLRGIEHMTAILHYMKVHVLYNKLILSRVNEEISAEGEIIKPETIALINTQIDEFLGL